VDDDDLEIEETEQVQYFYPKLVALNPYQFPVPMRL
jgi:hypothetical protein